MPQAWKGSRTVLRVLSVLKPRPLRIWGSSGMRCGGWGVTYTSVVMNPVSSERKRKRMKRQQQIETGRNNRETHGEGGGH